MKLIFKKDENAQITVAQIINGKAQDFSYVDMIKALIKSKKMDEPDISGNFTSAEIKSIKSMATFINKEVSPQEEVDII